MKSLIKSIKSIAKRQISMKDTTIIVLMAVFFVMVQNMAFWRKLSTLTDMHSLGGIILSLSVFVFLSCFISVIFSLFCWRFTTKVFLIFCLMASAATNYFALTYNIYMDKVMIANTMQTTSAEVGDLITWRLLLWLFCFGVIPSLLLSRIKITRANYWWKTILHRVLLIILSFIVLFAAAMPLYKDYASIGRNNKDLVKLITPNNYLNGLIGYVKHLTAKAQPLQQIGLDAKITKPANKKTIFIMVLGETSRAQNFSLNGYPRETNPKLKQYADLVNFTDVSSCGTATAISVPCMYSNMPRVDYKEQNRENVMDIIQRAGIYSFWRENDSGCKGVCNRIPNESVYDYLKKDSGLSEGLFHDEILLDNLDSRLAKDKGNSMIVLHTNGSHGPEYFQRYRQDLANLFKPSCDTKSIETCSKETLTNVYDNTILHVDDMLDKTIQYLKKHQDEYDVAMLYVSDHGESLGENGVYLHSAPYSLAPKEQTHIPMIFWANDSFYQNRQINRNCMQQVARKNSFSHDNIFHTLLGVWNIQTKEYDNTLNLFAQCQTR